MGATFAKAKILRPSGKLYLNNLQANLVDGAITLVDLDSIGDGFSDGIEITLTSRIEPGIGALFFINGQITFTNVIANKSYEAILRRTGVYFASGKKHSSCNDDLVVPVSAFCWGGVVDYYRLYAVSNSGDNTVDIAAGEDKTFLEVQFIRPG